MTDSDGLREKLARQSEDALGKLAQELMDSPFITGAITRAFDAREKAAQAQEAAMGAFNIPSAADIERLTRRLRSVSQRLEGIEDALDRIDQRLEEIARRADGAAGLDGRLDKLTRQVEQMASAVDAVPAPVPREQERLAVESIAAGAAAVEKQASKRASKSRTSGSAKAAATKRPAAKKA